MLAQVRSATVFGIKAADVCSKTGGRLIRHARHVTLQLAEGHLTERLFRQIVRRIERLAAHPT